MSNKKATENANQLVSEVKAFCADLFEATPVCYLSYACYHTSGHAEALVTNKEIIKYLLENNQYIRQDDLEEMAEYSLLTKTTSERDKQLCELLDVQVLFRICIKHDDKYEVVVFGANEPVETMYDFFVNNLALLKKYISYLKDKGQDLLKTAKQHPFKLSHFTSNKIEDRTIHSADEALETSLKQFPLEQKYRLSPREQECLALLADGHSAKSIARTLDLSVHTIQFYITNLKQKTKCRKLAELMKVYYEGK